MTNTNYSTTLGIAAYNENPNLLIYTIQSFKSANININTVHIVDDGSRYPITESQLRPWVDVPKLIVTQNKERLGMCRSRQIIADTIPNRGDAVLILSDAHMIAQRNDKFVGRYRETHLMGWPVLPFSNTKVPVSYGVESSGSFMNEGLIYQADKPESAFGPTSHVLAMSGATLKKLGGYCPLLIGNFCSDAWLAVRALAAKVPYAINGQAIRHFTVEDGKPKQPGFDPWVDIYNHLTIVDCIAQSETKCRTLYTTYKISHDGDQCEKAWAKFNEDEELRCPLKQWFIENQIDQRLL